MRGSVRCAYCNCVRSGRYNWVPFMGRLYCSATHARKAHKIRDFHPSDLTKGEDDETVRLFTDRLSGGLVRPG